MNKKKDWLNPILNIVNILLKYKHKKSRAITYLSILHYAYNIQSKANKIRKGAPFNPNEEKRRMSMKRERENIKEAMRTQ